MMGLWQTVTHNRTQLFSNPLQNAIATFCYVGSPMYARRIGISSESSYRWAPHAQYTVWGRSKLFCVEWIVDFLHLPQTTSNETRAHIGSQTESFPFSIKERYVVVLNLIFNEWSSIRLKRLNRKKTPRKPITIFSELANSSRINTAKSDCSTSVFTIQTIERNFNWLEVMNNRAFARTQIACDFCNALVFHIILT